MRSGPPAGLSSAHAHYANQCVTMFDIPPSVMAMSWPISRERVPRKDRFGR